MLLGLASCADPGGESWPDASSPLPRLLVEGAEIFPDHAGRITGIDSRRLTTAMDVVGLTDPGPPIAVILAGEDSVAAVSAPPWIAGYAFSDDGVAVLFPVRTPSYPDSTFEELLLHEVGHILVARASGGGKLPRWFNEGLALYIGRPWRLEDHSRVTWALVSRGETPVGELEDLFTRSQAAANYAYALAGAFVHDLLRRQGPDTAAQILALVASGKTFEQAFAAVVGVGLETAEASFWDRHTFWYRWIPIITSSATLWAAITALALVAFYRRRRRDAELRRRWAEEEQIEDLD